MALRCHVDLSINRLIQMVHGVVARVVTTSSGQTNLGTDTPYNRHPERHGAVHSPCWNGTTALPGRLRDSDDDDDDDDNLSRFAAFIYLILHVRAA